MIRDLHYQRSYNGFDKDRKELEVKGISPQHDKEENVMNHLKKLAAMLKTICAWRNCTGGEKCQEIEGRGKLSQWAYNLYKKKPK